MNPLNVTANVDAMHAYYRHLARVADEMCSECVAQRRHPESRYCVGCLGAGSGDTHTEDAA